jgi:hypothetical protein
VTDRTYPLVLMASGPFVARPSMRTTGSSVGGGRTRRVRDPLRSVAVALLQFGCCTVVLHAASLTLKVSTAGNGYTAQVRGGVLSLLQLIVRKRLRKSQN